MSDKPTYYRYDNDTPDVGDSNFDETRDKYLAALTAWGVLVPVEGLYDSADLDYEAAVNVLSTYRRLVLMGAEDTFVTTLDALFDAAVKEGKDE